MTFICTGPLIESVVRIPPREKDELIYHIIRKPLIRGDYHKILVRAGLTDEIPMDTINFNQDPTNLASDILDALQMRGRLEDGNTALGLFLRALKDSISTEERKVIDEVITKYDLISEERKLGMRSNQGQQQFRVVESYISEWALPGEFIVSWIKWDPKFKPDKIVLKYEADVYIHRFLNLDAKVLQQDRRSGENIVPKEYLEIPGFYGFHAVYDALPEQERNLEFVVEFYKGSNQIHIERLYTLISRPILKASVTPSDILIEEDNTSIKGPINIEVRNTGSVDAKTAAIIFKVNAPSGMKLTLQADKVSETGRENLIKASRINAMTIRGKGTAFVKITAEYIDNRNNKYLNPLATITLDIRQTIHDEIPVNSLRPRNELPLLSAA